MLEPSHYEGREQTYVKHFFLENYLERVAFNIYSFQTDFVFVDGFSGPWKSKNEKFEDTSFKIAIDKLRAIRKSLLETRRKKVDFRCMFIEKHRKPFRELKSAVDGIEDVEIKLVHGEFENHIADIQEFCKNSFSLIFVDPKGWQGIAMEKISPLFGLRGEVLINFMSDYINRFLNDPRPEIAASFDALFGGSWYLEWQNLVELGLSREAAAIEVYTKKLKNRGNFKYVTYTRILKPESERTYFYLIYATGHRKGIQEFRKIEKKTVAEQKRVRDAIKYHAQVAKTGMKSLFDEPLDDTARSSFEEEKRVQMRLGYATLISIFEANPDGIAFGEILGEVLQTPLVWENDLKDWIRELRNQGEIGIPELKIRQREPRPEYLIIPKGPS